MRSLQGYFLGVINSYRSVVNYLGIITHINRSFETTLAFLEDYNVYLAKRAVCRILEARTDIDNH